MRRAFPQERSSEHIAMQPQNVATVSEEYRGSTGAREESHDIDRTTVSGGDREYIPQQLVQNRTEQIISKQTPKNRLVTVSRYRSRRKSRKWCRALLTERLCEVARLKHQERVQANGGENFETVMSVLQERLVSQEPDRGTL